MVTYSLFWDVVRRRLVAVDVPGERYLIHLQGSISQKTGYDAWT